VRARIQQVELRLNRPLPGAEEVEQA
jgi:hypothetical protein